MNTQEVEVTETKLNRLVQTITTLSAIKDHVYDIHSQLGVKEKPVVDNESNLDYPLNNLVDVVNNLPDAISEQASIIHNLLNEIQESLI